LLYEGTCPAEDVMLWDQVQILDTEAKASGFVHGCPPGFHVFATQYGLTMGGLNWANGKLH